MYNTAFGTSFNIAKACAVGVYIFIVIMLLTLLSNKLTKQKD
jgi:ABC-type sugar transport system permease subunit